MTHHLLFIICYGPFCLFGVDMSVRSQAVIKGRFFAFFCQGFSLFGKLYRPYFRNSGRFLQTVLCVIGRFNGHLAVGGLFGIVSLLVSEGICYVYVSGRIVRVARGFLVDSCRRCHGVVELFLLRTVGQRVIYRVPNESGVNCFPVKVANCVLRDNQAVQLLVRALGKRGQGGLISYPEVQR